MEVSSGLRVLHSGLFTTVQDRGRPGFRRFGVPVGGALDEASAAWANALVGNGRDEAVLEFTSFGGTYRAASDLALAFAGGTFDLKVEGRPSCLRPPCGFDLAAGETLRVGGSADAPRGYLAVRGGWLTDRVLGSRSSEERLNAGDLIPALPGRLGANRRTLQTIVMPGLVRVCDGLDASALDLGAFRVDPRSDRRGTRLVPLELGWIERKNIELNGPLARRPSAPVAPGSVQFTGEELIVLGRAGGTMGGYPVLAQVIGADLDRLARLAPGATVRLERVSIDEAERLGRLRRLELDRALARLRSQRET